MEKVQKAVRVREYHRREAVFVPGREPERVYLLLTGRVKVTRIDPDTGRELILFIVSPGEPFGILARTSSRDAGTSAVALQRSLVGFIRRADFDRLAQHHTLAAELNRLLTERFMRVTHRLEGLAFRDISSRLARVLLRLADEFPHDVDGHRAIDVRLTQQDLADLIGATRERTNKALADLRRRGLIGMRRRTIAILDPTRLQEIAAAPLL